MSILVPGAETIDLEPILASYRANGFAKVGHVGDESAMKALGDRLDAIMMGEVVYDGMFFQKESATNEYDALSYGKGWEGPSLDYRKIEKLEKDPLFLAWLGNPLFERIARAVIAPSPKGIVLYRAFVMNKSAKGGSPLPWHQDGGKFWGLDRDPELQIWTALDDAPEEAGCVEFVPGTHTRGLATAIGGVVPPNKIEERGLDEAEIVKVPARRGDVLLIHNMVWHRSGLNKTGHARRGFSTCYMSGDTQCTRKKRAPREFFRVWA